MRRKPGTLIPIEGSILAAGLELRLAGRDEFHGFLLAKHIREREGARLFKTHGALYRALNRMEDAGLLVSRWEQIGERESRPRRRLYRITAAGQQALARAGGAEPSHLAQPKQGLAHT